MFVLIELCRGNRSENGLQSFGFVSVDLDSVETDKVKPLHFDYLYHHFQPALVGKEEEDDLVAAIQ